MDKDSIDYHEIKEEGETAVFCIELMIFRVISHRKLRVSTPSHPPNRNFLFNSPASPR